MPMKRKLKVFHFVKRLHKYEWKWKGGIRHHRIPKVIRMIKVSMYVPWIAGVILYC